MKNRKIAFCAMLLMFLGTSKVHSQTAVVSAGGEASGGGGEASYTIGQVSYLTYTGSNGTSSEGVQQPYEVFVATGLDEENSLDLNITTYPNPATNFIELELDREGHNDMSYSLFNATGKLVSRDDISGTNVRVDLYDLEAGIYYIKILDEDSKPLKTVKIIKQ